MAKGLIRTELPLVTTWGFLIEGRGECGARRLEVKNGW